MNDQMEQIANLLQEAGKAHHSAFAEVNGDDPDWPLWYAQYVREPLSSFLGHSFTLSELAHWFLVLDRHYAAVKPDTPWFHFYAQYLVDAHNLADPGAIGRTRPASAVPALTVEQMIRVDKMMVDTYRISLTQMMENAGRSLARLACARFLNDDPRGKSVVALAGTGGNGGGAMAAARHLANYGASVRVVTTRPAASFRDAPQRQLAILQNMGLPIHEDTAADLEEIDISLVLDGMIGYSLRGAPRGRAANLIDWANRQAVPVLALDIPSGLHGTSGEAFLPTMAASATLTLALPKQGLLEKEAQPYVGELYLADIGVPPQLYDRLGLDLRVPLLFATTDILRLR